MCVAARAATKVKPALVNAAHAFYHDGGVCDECPDYNIAQCTKVLYRTSESSLLLR